MVKSRTCLVYALGAAVMLPLGGGEPPTKEKPKATKSTVTPQKPQNPGGPKAGLAGATQAARTKAANEKAKQKVGVGGDRGSKSDEGINPEKVPDYSKEPVLPPPPPPPSEKAKGAAAKAKAAAKQAESKQTPR
jgi:hypothetical protein